MVAFQSKPLNKSPIHRTLRKHPSLFGVPFVLLMVGASFALQQFTQTRYDLQDQKVTQMSKEEALGLKKDRKKFDIREEYFKLSQEVENNYEIKRIERPKGLPEWGVPPEERPSKNR